MRLRHMLLGGLAALTLAGPARAEIPGGVLKVGVLNDASGPFADQSGHGSLVAAQLAAEDFAPEAGGLRVEIVYGDHQNKPDVGSAIVRHWLDQDGVDAVADAVNSAVGLAVNTVVHEKNRTFIATNVGTSDLTGKFCQPTTVQWNMDTWAFGNAIARAMTQPGTSWYFVSFNYALGQALVRDTSAEVVKLGGTVAGSVEHPLGTTDFSSYLLQAQSSGAKVVGLADTGADAINAIKQAGEFGLMRGGQKMAALFLQVVDIRALGLPAAQGLVVTESFYWDLNEATRAFSRRFAARMDGRMPTANQAAVYGSVLAYLRAAKAADTVDGDRVLAQMRSAPIADPLYGPVTVRADGRAVHAMYVFRVKSPAESHGPWDVYDVVATIPAELAFRPVKEGGCRLVE
jgi:branched-chain amino acid transport system substrate-binding protein